MTHTYICAYCGHVQKVILKAQLETRNCPMRKRGKCAYYRQPDVRIVSQVFREPKP